MDTMARAVYYKDAEMSSQRMTSSSPNDRPAFAPLLLTAANQLLRCSISDRVERQESRERTRRVSKGHPILTAEMW